MQRSKYWYFPTPDEDIVFWAYGVNLMLRMVNTTRTAKKSKYLRFIKGSL